MERKRKVKKEKINEKDINKIWRSYKKDNALELKRKLMLHYIWLVKYALQSMNLPSSSILDDADFLNIGILGLHEAIEKFEPERGYKFESYALMRIKGTVKDELRKLDWLSRTARRKANEFLKASDKVRNQLGGDISSEEIRKQLNVTPKVYNSYLTAAAAAKAYMNITERTKLAYNENEGNPLEEYPDFEQQTLEAIENEERIAFISEALRSLDERKRLIVTLYYYENLTFKEIGKILNISESRVCQIHGQVLSDLRTKLAEYDNA